MSKLDVFLDALKTSGYRLTPQRKAICQLLAESDDHPSAQLIYEQLLPQHEMLSLATVYNTLEALTQLGVINVLGEVGESEATRCDPDIQPHVNLACVKCHRIIDLQPPSVFDMAKEVKDASGYELYGSRVLYYGLCPDCQKT